MAGSIRVIRTWQRFPTKGEEMKLVRFNLGEETYLVSRIQATPVTKLLNSKDKNEKARGERLLKKVGHKVTAEAPEPPEGPKAIPTQGAVSSAKLQGKVEG